ncbi:UNVERIFIED_CONTAM: hypothetical protein Sradi_2754700 [Sesamum radiatum]|uniref:Uncharacterized protein n=1 Tax=Sesamum radiatum TaxID=300843 RepID=A0AAW2S9B9_SESRA
MGTEVLRPQDLLADRFRAPPASFQRRRNFPGNGNLTNLIVNRKPSYNNAGYRKTSPRSDKKRINAAGDNGGTKKTTHGGAVADTRRRDDGTNGGPYVTILRRGQSLDSCSPKMRGGSNRLKSPRQKPFDDLAVISTRRSGPPSPVNVPKQIRMSPPPLSDMYAGSACSQSPSPRSVPLPSFFNKKQQNDSIDKSFDDSATRDLRRLLRLD